MELIGPGRVQTPEDHIRELGELAVLETEEQPLEEILLKLREAIHMQIRDSRWRAIQSVPLIFLDEERFTHRGKN